MYGQAKVCYSQNRFPFIFACIYHKNMNIFSMCWRCLKQVNIAGLRSTAPFSTWLLSSTIIDTSWKFCYNHKLKVLLQITSWKFCYNRQTESSATITSWKFCYNSHKLKVLENSLRQRWLFCGGKKLFSLVTIKVFSMFVVIARTNQWLKWEQINLSAHIVQQHFDWIALFIPVWNKFQKTTLDILISWYPTVPQGNGHKGVMIFSKHFGLKTTYVHVLSRETCWST